MSGSRVSQNSAAETGSLSRKEMDEADGLFFKSVQNKRRKQQALRKKGCFYHQIAL